MANSSPSLTTEQQAALRAVDRSVSLSAGAGCGKTFVLTERFLAEVAPGSGAAALDDVVAITFTEAAAREMRSRVRARCREKLSEAMTEDRAAWQRLVRQLDAARISTIHSFCAQLLRSRTVEVGLDPHFETLDQAAADLMRSQAVDDCLRELLEERDARALELAAHFGLAPLRDHLVRLVNSASPAVLSKWQATSPDELVAVWQEHYRQETLPRALQALCGSPQFLELRELADRSPAATTKLAAHLGELAECMDQCAQYDPASGAGTPPWQALRELAKANGPAIKRNWNVEGDYQRYKSICEAVRNSIDGTLSSSPPAGEAAQRSATLGLQLLDLTGAAQATYTAAKERRGCLDFEDLLLTAHRLLNDSPGVDGRKGLVASTQLLMVDEFQDTDPVQVEIAQAFCGSKWRERGLFVVGDFKQSIYRFRGADPTVSIDLRRELPASSRLSLTTNFRSQPAILEFVNALFFDQFDEPYEPLRAHRPQTTARPAVEFLWTEDPPRDSGGDLPPEKINAAQRRRREARWIARRLRHFIDSQEPIIVDESGDEPAARGLQPGDVAILMRAMSDVPPYEEALREYGLDYYLVGGQAFYAQQEVYDILHLLRAIESQADELSLAGALRSPFFSLTDETLFWLIETHGSLNAGLSADEPPATLSTNEAAKVRRAAGILDQLRSVKNRLLTAELLELALKLTGLDAALMCEFLGQRKLANVRKLIEQARNSDRVSPGDLPGFITQLAEFVVRAPKEAPAATQTDADVIRIMSIHLAKGLEFPLVVVADLDRGLGGWQGQPAVDSKLGPLVASDDKEIATGMKLHQADERVAELEERKRLLYVACTRAADYLILSSSLEDLAKPKQDWLTLLDRRFGLVDGVLQAELPTGYATPEIRVTTAEPECAARESDEQRGRRLSEVVEQVRLQAAQLKTKGPRVELARAGPAPITPPRRRAISFSQIAKLLKPDAEIPGDLLANDHAREDEREALPPVGDHYPLQLGQLVHAVLERIDFSDATGASQWSELLAPQFVDDRTEEAAAEATTLAEQFLSSPRARALVDAPVVRREVDFLLTWPSPGPTEYYFNGVIDCLYQDAGGVWHVLDYKSNQTSPENVSVAAAPYEIQMFVYGLAVEQVIGTPPTESVLFFLRPGIEHRFVWDDSRKSALMSKINEAIAKL